MNASFKEDLARGHEGEALFHSLFPHLERTDGRKGDFKLPNGELLEIKTDHFSHEKTPNYFMEYYSYDDKPGGPFQSLASGVKYFVYFFSKSGEFYIFDTALLCRYLEWRFQDEPFLEVKNQKHITRGKLIKRLALAHLLIGPGQIL